MITENSPIGIFDSGLGGISVLNACIKIMPNEHYIYYGDSKFAPYGTKDKDEIIERCIQICDFFMKKNVKSIIVACNTATSAAISVLRERYSIPIIGMEPALKLAAQDKHNMNIVVMATKLTLQEEKFASLLQQYRSDHHVISIPCPEFVEAIETDNKDFNQVVSHQLNQYADILQIQPINYVVLGCTHFVFLRKQIQAYFGDNVMLLDGNLGTAKHLQCILQEQHLCSSSDGKVDVYNSDKQKIEYSKRLITPAP